MNISMWNEIVKKAVEYHKEGNGNLIDSWSKQIAQLRKRRYALQAEIREIDDRIERLAWNIKQVQ